jgi:hypothetical protein
MRCGSCWDTQVCFFLKSLVVVYYIHPFKVQINNGHSSQMISLTFLTSRPLWLNSDNSTRYDLTISTVCAVINADLVYGV